MILEQIQNRNYLLLFFWGGEVNVKNIWLCPLLFHLRFDFKKYDFDARATLPKLGYIIRFSELASVRFCNRVLDKYSHSCANEFC